MVYETEQEQIEALKKWWNENGKAMVAGVLVALVGFSGWNYWQTYQQDRAEKASALYETVAKTLGDKDAVSVETFVSDIQKLQGEYSGTFYADAASLIQAKKSVEKGDMETAEQALIALVKTTSDDAIRDLGNLRLARVYYGQEKYQEALTYLSEPSTEAFRSVFMELKGDIYKADNKLSEARKAYQTAMEQLDNSGTSGRENNLQMKLDDLVVTKENS